MLKIREAKLGKDHPDTIYSLFHLGNTEEDLQQYEKAVEYHQQALERARRSTDFSKEDMADIFASLGSAYDGGGNYRRSISSYEKAVSYTHLLPAINVWLWKTESFLPADDALKFRGFVKPVVTSLWRNTPCYLGGIPRSS